MSKLDILYWDEHYIAVAKPAGLLVHPYKEKSKDRSHLMRSTKAQTGLYLYPIHRLDKPVSGIVLFGLSKEATSKIKEVWNTDQVEKKYIALCKGKLDESGSFDFSLKSDTGAMQEAHTEFKCLGSNEDFSLADITIRTGRKHQIRRHFSRRMHNLIGDAKYGQGEINRAFKHKYKFYRLFLHSYELNFIHPFTGRQIQVKNSLPKELSKILDDQKLKVK